MKNISLEELIKINEKITTLIKKYDLHYPLRLDDVKDLIKKMNGIITFDEDVDNINDGYLIIPEENLFELILPYNDYDDCFKKIIRWIGVLVLDLDILNNDNKLIELKKQGYFLPSVKSDRLAYFFVINFIIPDLFFDDIINHSQIKHKLKKNYENCVIEIAYHFNTDIRTVKEKIYYKKQVV